MNMKRLKFIYTVFLILIGQSLCAQTDLNDSQQLDLKIRAFISDTTIYVYNDPDDSLSPLTGKTDRIGSFNRKCQLLRVLAIEDTIAKFKKNKTIYHHNKYYLPIDEYGMWDFENEFGGSGSMSYFENNKCIKRPFVMYNWKIEFGYLNIEVITGHDNCSF
jgi:hypothetical protein